MSKLIDTLVQASIDSKNYAGVLLARFEFLSPAGYLRCANTYQNIYWDEGAGEEEYLGVGNLADISVAPETNELGATVVTFTLSGIPQNIINESFDNNYRNQPVYLYYGTLDKDTYAVEGGATGPILVFAGLMDYSVIDYGQQATVSISATSRLTDWERIKGGTFSHYYQRNYVDPSDQGFKYIVALQNKDVSWGRYSPTDGYTGNPGTNGPGNNGGGKERGPKG